MALKDVSGPAVATAGAGVVLLWSGLTGRKVTLVARSLLSARAPADVAPDVTIDAPPAEATGGSWESAGGGWDTAPAAGTTTGGGGTPAANRALGQRMAAAYGWSSGAQWQALDALVVSESGWSTTAENPSSGAYGIPQALPPTKLPYAGQKSGGHQAAAQIAWLLSYVKGRYGDPVTAWQFHRAHGWY